MRTKSAILAGMALCIPLFSFAGDRLLVQVPAVLDPAAPIARSVKNECGVELLVGNHVFQQVSKRLGGASQIEDIGKAGQEKVLQLTLLNVHGVGGGWSGPKEIMMRADVLQSDRKIETAVFTRRSSGGMSGGFSGTCLIMERIAVALGKDVATWTAGVMMTHATAIVPPDMPTAEGQPGTSMDAPKP